MPVRTYDEVSSSHATCHPDHQLLQQPLTVKAMHAVVCASVHGVATHGALCNWSCEAIYFHWAPLLLHLPPLEQRNALPQ